MAKLKAAAAAPMAGGGPEGPGGAEGAGGTSSADATLAAAKRGGAGSTGEAKTKVKAKVKLKTGAAAAGGRVEEGGRGVEGGAWNSEESIRKRKKGLVRRESFVGRANMAAGKARASVVRLATTNADEQMDSLLEAQVRRCSK
jgi:hypothetical protein